MPIEAPVAPDVTLPAESAAFPDFDTAFPDGLDNPTPAPPPKPAPESVTPTDTEKQPDSTAPKSGAGQSPAPKTDKSPEPTPEPSGDNDYNPPQVAKPSELKGWALRMGKKAKEADARSIQLEQRIRQLESQPPRQQQDNSAMAQQLAEANKRIEAYENDLRLSRYERSDDYKQKFEKPWKEAQSRALREVAELIAYEPNPDNPEQPKERMATKADFEEVYSLPLGQASRLAKQRFGDAAGIVLGHRQKIRELTEAAYQAVEEYRGKGVEQEKASTAQAAQREQAMGAMFSKATEAFSRKFPETFQERQGDTEGNELLRKGKEFANAMFSGNENMSPVDVVKRDARAFSWLSAYPRLLRDVKSLKAQLDEANATIASIKGSGPGKPKPTAETAPSSDKGWEAAFDDTVK